MATKRVLVYGGKGALGRTCVSFFKQQNWVCKQIPVPECRCFYPQTLVSNGLSILINQWVGSLDLAANEEADANILVQSDDPLVQQEKQVTTSVKELIADQKLDAILCVAGGWAGGNATNADCVKNTELMVKQSQWSSVIAAKLAAEFLTEGGFLGLTGAKAALEATPGMIGYGMAKAAVHHMTKSLAAKGGGLPENVTVLSILPVTLDTPMNRKWMPKADTSSWTPLEFVAQQLYQWSSSQDERPESGSLVQLITTDGKTELVLT